MVITQLLLSEGLVTVKVFGVYHAASNDFEVGPDSFVAHPEYPVFLYGRLFQLLKDLLSEFREDSLECSSDRVFQFHEEDGLFATI